MEKETGDGDEGEMGGGLLFCTQYMYRTAAGRGGGGRSFDVKLASIGTVLVAYSSRISEES
jgi:hypothetical protein